MATDENIPHGLVQRFIDAVPGTAGTASVELLQMLANALNNVIGEEGFESLLMRSVRRASVRYPWLELDPRERHGDPEFEQLRQAFQGRDPTEAQGASMLLFITLVDTLTVLVGAHLTTLILTSALASARAGLQEQGIAR